MGQLDVLVDDHVIEYDDWSGCSPGNHLGVRQELVEPTLGPGVDARQDVGDVAARIDASGVGGGDQQELVGKARSTGGEPANSHALQDAPASEYGNTVMSRGRGTSTKTLGAIWVGSALRSRPQGCAVPCLKLSRKSRLASK